MDFFDADGVADAVTAALAAPGRFNPLRRAARDAVRARYDLRRVCLPAWLELMGDVAGRAVHAPNKELVHA